MSSTESYPASRHASCRKSSAERPVAAQKWACWPRTAGPERLLGGGDEEAVPGSRPGEAREHREPLHRRGESHGPLVRLLGAHRVAEHEREALDPELLRDEAVLRGDVVPDRQVGERAAGRARRGRDAVAELARADHEPAVGVERPSRPDPGIQRGLASPSTCAGTGSRCRGPAKASRASGRRGARLEACRRARGSRSPSARTWSSATDRPPLRGRASRACASGRAPATPPAGSSGRRSRRRGARPGTRRSSGTGRWSPGSARTCPRCSGRASSWPRSPPRTGGGTARAISGDRHGTCCASGAEKIPVVPPAEVEDVVDGGVHVLVEGRAGALEDPLAARRESPRRRRRAHRREPGGR